MEEAVVKPEGYIPRIVDEQLERYLRIFGAVEVQGTKWCGKTWTARQHGASISYVDAEFSTAQDAPKLMLKGTRPHVIDEWQQVPAIWNLVRHEVDERRSTRGAFILTGSSTPYRPRKDGVIDNLHSGAGRIGRIRMYPMTLSESGDSEKLVSLRQLFEKPPEEGLVADDPDKLIDLVCRGGWPEAIGLSPNDAQLVAREYLEVICQESAPRRDLDASIAERVIASLARNLGQSATYATLLADVEREGGSSALTARKMGDYLEFLKQVFLLVEIPGWEPPSRSRKRIQAKPKRYLADPSLAIAALGMSPAAPTDDWQTFSLAFENLCIRDLQVYARAHELARPQPLRYYRDDAGLEADVIIELVDGRWAAFEIKTSDVKIEAAVTSLKRLRKKLCKNPKARTRPPEFMAVIVGIGKYVRLIEEGIYVIPIRALTA